MPIELFLNEKLSSHKSLMRKKKSSTISLLCLKRLCRKLRRLKTIKGFQTSSRKSRNLNKQLLIAKRKSSLSTSVKKCLSSQPRHINPWISSNRLPCLILKCGKLPLNSIMKSKKLSVVLYLRTTLRSLKKQSTGSF